MYKIKSKIIITILMMMSIVKSNEIDSLEWHRDVVPVKNDSLLLLERTKNEISSKPIKKDNVKDDVVYLKDAIKGILLTKKENKPIKNAEIKLTSQSKEQETFSDETGMFVFKNVKPGQVTIKVIKKGVQDLEKVF